jgi:hypothetical protein
MFTTPRIQMKFSSDLASIHGYLCSDGYVIRNPKQQKHKYYHIGFRNTDLTLLKDFQTKFNSVFGIKPTITKNKDRCKIQNKELTLKLIKEFGSFYSNDWKLPTLSKLHLKYWIRAYFDSDGWASVNKRKSRAVGLESINIRGLNQIQNVLKKTFLIKSTIYKHKKRNIWSLIICGKENINKFKNKIGFLHPKKRGKINDAINSYVDYNWKIPIKFKDFIEFIRDKGRVSYHRNEVRFNSKIQKNLIDLQNKLLKISIKSRLNGPWKNPYGSTWYCLSINIDNFNRIIGEK